MIKKTVTSPESRNITQRHIGIPKSVLRSNYIRENQKPEKVKKFPKLKFDDNGLIPAIIQDYRNKEVLMIAYMNKESLKMTLRLGKTCFWSRSRRQYWVKGETSGNFQFIKSIAYDCDGDALLIKVRQLGVACHTGNRSCFYRLVKW